MANCSSFMTIFGLNSPEIFIILIIFLAILGPKRWEKGFDLFLKLLKFLLSDDVDQTSNYLKLDEKKEFNQSLKDNSNKEKKEEKIDSGKKEEVNKQKKEEKVEKIDSGKKKEENRQE